MSKQFSPLIDIYRKKIKEGFPKEEVDEVALNKAYRYIKDVWEGVAYSILIMGKEIPHDLVKTRDDGVLLLYVLHSAPKKLMSNPESDRFLVRKT